MLCIDAVGFKAVRHMAGPSSGSPSGVGIHDHSKVSDPIYEPANPIQVLEWIWQSARKFSILSVLGACISSYDKFPFVQIWNKELSISLGQCPIQNTMNNYCIKLKPVE